MSSRQADWRKARRKDLAAYVGISTRLLSVFGFNIYLNWSLQSLGLGVVAGLLFRMLRALTFSHPAA